MCDARILRKLAGMGARLRIQNLERRTRGRARILALLFCAAILAGCGHSSPPMAGGANGTGTSTAGTSSAAHDQAAANTLKTTPLTEDDINLYLTIMKAAADQIKNATGRDRAALDMVQQVNSGKITSAMTPQQAGLLARGVQMSRLDDEVATQRGVSARYGAIRDVIEGLIGPASCPSCSGDGGSQPVSAAQQQEWAAEEATMQTDSKLLNPYRDQIIAVQKQVRGIVSNAPGAHGATGAGGD